MVEMADVIDENDEKIPLKSDVNDITSRRPPAASPVSYSQWLRYPAINDKIREEILAQGGLHYLQSDQDFIGEPSYRIVIDSMDTTVDPGKPFKFNIYISGAGDSDYSKLFIRIPPSLAKTISKDQHGDELNVYVTKRWKHEGNQVLISTDEEPEPVVNTFNTGVPLLLIKAFNPEIPDRAHITNEGEVDRINPKEPNRAHPPLSCEFTVSENVSAGDYYVYLNLVYRDRYGPLRWHTDKEILKIHVNHWYERDYVKYLLLLPLIPAIAATISIYGMIYSLFLSITYTTDIFVKTLGVLAIPVYASIAVYILNIIITIIKAMIYLSY